MKEIEIPNYCTNLFTVQVDKVLDSGHMLHFYFKSAYGLTSCSYTKDSLIALFYKELRAFQI